ncbi:MAG: cytochrome c1 [Pseudomonadota bacterium]
MSHVLKIAATAIAMGTLMVGGVHAAGGGGNYDTANNDVGNSASLQRGAAGFMNYCAGCHSAEYVRYNTLGDALGLTDDQLIENLMFNAEKTFEVIDVSMRADDATRWFNKKPPDLSLVARSKGADYLYTFLRSYYIDDSTPTGWNNTVLSGTSMPHPLWALEGLKAKAEHAESDEGDAHGGGSQAQKFDVLSSGALSTEEYDQFVLDIVNFLDFIAEPVQLQRQQIGIWVMAFLLLFFILSLLLKKEIWKDVK